MRVITGTARGKRLKELSGDNVRPTADRVKEGLFSSIQFDIEGRRVLDLFAGSGQLGIEALSRGAQTATFIDNSIESVGIIKENLKTTCLEKQAVVFRSDYSDFLSATKSVYDIAFIDPPFALGLWEDALKKIIGVMSEAGIIICEHPKEVTLPEIISDFKVRKQYRYGKILVTIYARSREQ